MKNTSDHIMSKILMVLLCSAATGFAATSSAVSNRTTVDTGNSEQIEPLGLELKVEAKKGGRILVDYKTNWEGLPRKASTVPNSKTTRYFAMKIPSTTPGETGFQEILYGLELKAKVGGVKSDGLPWNDSLKYKVGGLQPTDQTPEGEWTPALFNKIFNIEVEGGATCYFKITMEDYNASIYVFPPPPLKMQVRCKSARLCNAQGDPIEGLNPEKNLWVVAHGKKDGERSFRSMHKAIADRQKEMETNDQVVSIDWASGAKGWTVDLTNGRYFVSFGKNVAHFLKQQGYAPDKGEVNWVGHSWGAMIGCEVARFFSGDGEVPGPHRIIRMIALDPATQAFGGYDDDRVDFKKWSDYSVGVKGGLLKSQALFGSTKKVKSAHFSIRLRATKINEPLSEGNAFFNHSLPRDWFEGLFADDENDIYDSYLRKKILWTGSDQPSMPWGEWGKIGGMDLECQGTALWRKENEEAKNKKATFLTHKFLKFEKPNGRNKKAKASEAETTRFKVLDAGLWWKW